MLQQISVSVCMKSPEKLSNSDRLISYVFQTISYVNLIRKVFPVPAGSSKKSDFLQKHFSLQLNVDGEHWFIY